MIEKRPRFWRVVLVYWLAQPVAVGFVLNVWLLLLTDGDSMYGMEDSSEIVLLAFEPVYWAYVLAFSGAMTVAQACYLWPARKPAVTAGRGRSVKSSVIIAGLMVGLGGLALTFGLVALFDGAMETTGDAVEALRPHKRIMLVALLVMVFWVVPTLVLLRFCKPGRRETVLGRLANRILLGTAAEALLLIPVDAMIRRRTECYCAEGSFIGLTLLGMIGFVGAGPAVLLPLFAKRRRGWYRTHCNACGYDMAGDPSAARCPECGRAWGSGGGGTGAGEQTAPAADHPEQAEEPDEPGDRAGA